MLSNNRSLKYLLNWLITGTRGGVNRAKILETLKDEPQNANQFAVSLGLDYKTIRHHLDILEKNNLITSVGDRYGVIYFLSQLMDDNYFMFEELKRKMEKNKVCNNEESNQS